MYDRVMIRGIQFPNYGHLPRENGDLEIFMQQWFRATLFLDVPVVSAQFFYSQREGQQMPPPLCTICPVSRPIILHIPNKRWVWKILHAFRRIKPDSVYAEEFMPDSTLRRKKRTLLECAKVVRLFGHTCDYDQTHPGLLTIENRIFDLFDQKVVEVTTVAADRAVVTIPTEADSYSESDLTSSSSS